MKATIYDFQDAPKEIEIDAENDFCLFVQVLSGDEAVIECKQNGKIAVFDSSDSRIKSFYDRCYVVPRAEIKEWNTFEWRSGRKSYDRADAWAEKNKAMREEVQ